MAGEAGERELRRVRRRLALLIILLLCGLLLLLGAGVYITMRSALLAPAKQAVSTRARAQLPYLQELVQEKPDSTEGPDSSAEQEVGGVAITYISPSLHVLAGSSDPFGKSVPDPTAARRALLLRSPLYSTRAFKSETYLIYTLPLVRKGIVMGLVQTGISEAQYDQGLQSLLSVLAGLGGLGVLASAGISLVVVRRALQPVRASMRRQRDFVADAAHELRTPLAIMRTAAELSLAEGSQEEEEVALEQVLAQGNHLTHLVDDLSLLARTDSGAITIEHERVELDRVTVTTADDMELLAQEAEIALHRRVPETPVFVCGDEARLRQLLVILLDNAIKHTPPGGTVTVPLEREGRGAVIEVRDTGPGIPPSDLPHIFDRFYRATPERSNGNGAGLGLAIGYWIVEAHGGHISASNLPGEGARFSVSLPVA